MPSFGLSMIAGALMTKAQIEFCPPPAAGSTNLGAAAYTLKFQFNPSKLAITKAARWNQAAPDRTAAHAPAPEFNGPSPATLNLEFVLDKYEDGDVDIAKATSWLAKCLGCVPDRAAGSGSEQAPLPYYIKFSWGSWGWGHNTELFVGYVTQTAIEYQHFDFDGEPSRIKCTVNMTQLSLAPARQNPTSGTLELQRTRTVLAGDTLASIAYEEYGSPTRWRDLAEANGLDDPSRIKPGTHLLIPLRAPAPALSNGTG